MSVLKGKVAAGGGRIVSFLSNLINNPTVPYHDYTTAKSAFFGFFRDPARAGAPEDLARVVLMSASPWADFEPGQYITRDGGLLMA